MLQQLLAQLGGGDSGGVPGGFPGGFPEGMPGGVPGGMPGGPPEEPGMEQPDEDWLTTAINAVHSGMVSESNPRQVSLLGAILNQLTTFQANAMGKGAGG